MQLYNIIPCTITFSTEDKTKIYAFYLKSQMNCFQGDMKGDVYLQVWRVAFVQT